jgi:regulator of PEP synthase PpsR (kinase-PPPase family)
MKAALDSVEDPRRIVALTIDPQTLRQIRRKRMECLAGGSFRTTAPTQIRLSEHDTHSG